MDEKKKKKLWSSKECAIFLDRAESTMRKDRTRRPRVGPPFIKYGGSIKYDPDEVQKWIREQNGNERGEE